MSKIYTEQLQIQYLDVDRSNKLTSKAIINIMQDVAGSHSESIHDGLNYKAINQTAWLVLNWKVDIYNRPKYKDVLTIHTWVSKLEKCFSYREFEMYMGDKIVAKAESKWVLVNANTGKITKIPLDLMNKYEASNNMVFGENIDEKIKLPQNAKLVYEEKVCRTKIDTNNHLNNVYYLDLAVESLPEEIYENEELNHIEIMYKKASKYKETLKCFYVKEENKHIVMVKDQEGNIHAVIRMW